MFFVQDGSCIARSAADPSKIYAEFETGSFFGEQSVLTGCKRTSDVVTLSYCEFLVLQKLDFDRALEKFPGYKKEFALLAEYRQKNKDRAGKGKAEKHMTWKQAARKIRSANSVLSNFRGAAALSPENEAKEMDEEYPETDRKASISSCAARKASLSTTKSRKNSLGASGLELGLKMKKFASHTSRDLLPSRAPLPAS
jgi:CRP-like cAMP-binding protein